MIDPTQRMEPAHVDFPGEALSDAIAELSAASATLGRALHPRTLATLVEVVRLVEAHHGNLIDDRDARFEADAFVRVRAHVDHLAEVNRLPEPASVAFIQWLHGELHREAGDRAAPPPGTRALELMDHFAGRYAMERLGRFSRILVMAASHHRFSYLHPLPDSNGRVGRLVGHAMAHRAGVAGHGLWSLARGLAIGLEGPGDYRRMMDHAELPRQDDLDGRDPLSQHALRDFVLWFVRVMLREVHFMEGLLEPKALGTRLNDWVDQQPRLGHDAKALLQDALIRGEFDRAEIAGITGLSRWSARRLLNDLLARGVLGEDEIAGMVSLRVPPDTWKVVLPGLSHPSPGP